MNCIGGADGGKGREREKEPKRNREKGGKGRGGILIMEQRSKIQKQAHHRPMGMSQGDHDD